MAFIPAKDLPVHPQVGRKFRLNEDIRTIGGKFERGTLMTVSKVVQLGGISAKDKINALHLVDEEGHGLHLNHSSFDKLDLV